MMDYVLGLGQIVGGMPDGFLQYLAIMGWVMALFIAGILPILAVLAVGIAIVSLLPDKSGKRSG